MTRQRTMEETAQRREAQRNERHLRRTGRLPVREAVAAAAAQVPRFTRHPGSKRGATHRKAATADVARSKAHTWSVVTGKPLPPAARIRTAKVSNAVPVPVAERTARRGAQRKRDRHKVGRQLAAVREGTKAHAALAQFYAGLRESVR